MQASNGKALAGCWVISRVSVIQILEFCKMYSDNHYNYLLWFVSGDLASAVFASTDDVQKCL